MLYNNQKHILSHPCNEIKTHSRFGSSDLSVHKHAIIKNTFLKKNLHYLVQNQETNNKQNNNQKILMNKHLLQSKTNKTILNPLNNINTFKLDETKSKLKEESVRNTEGHNRIINPYASNEKNRLVFPLSTSCSVSRNGIKRRINDDDYSSVMQQFHKSSSQYYDKFNLNLMKSLSASSTKNFLIKGITPNNELYDMVIDVNDKLKHILLKNNNECSLPKIQKGAKPVIVSNCSNLYGNSNYLGERYDPYNYQPVNPKNRTKRNSYGCLYVY